MIAPVRNPVLTEGIKLLLAVLYTAWHKRRSVTETAKIKSWDDVEAHEALPLTGASPDAQTTHDQHASTSTREKPSHSPGLRISRTTAFMFILVAAALFACYRRKVSQRHLPQIAHKSYTLALGSQIAIEEHALDRFTQYLIVSLASISTAGASYLFLSRTCSLSQAQSIALQVSQSTARSARGLWDCCSVRPWSIGLRNFYYTGKQVRAYVRTECAERKFSVKHHRYTDTSHVDTLYRRCDTHHDPLFSVH